MKSFKHIAKAVQEGKKAYDKSKVDDIASAAKKAKEVEEKAKATKRVKAAYDTGVEEGIKKGKKKMKRKVAGYAAAAGAGYLEYKTGAISKGVAKLKDMYDKRNAKPQTHKGAPLKPTGENKPAWRSSTGVKGSLSKTGKAKYGGTTKSKKR